MYMDVHVHVLKSGLQLRLPPLIITEHISKALWLNERYSQLFREYIFKTTCPNTDISGPLEALSHVTAVRINKSQCRMNWRSLPIHLLVQRLGLMQATPLNLLWRWDEWKRQGGCGEAFLSPCCIVPVSPPMEKLKRRGKKTENLLKQEAAVMCWTTLLYNISH